MSTDLCPVMLFSGKGGVGKTTLAAATAVHSAHLGSRVLVMSTDPAHSLSDVFGAQLGPRPINLSPRLDALEIDAKGMFNEVFDKLEGHDAWGLTNFFKTMSETPGVDEFGAIEVLLSALETAQHDVVILDTAPTGHTLRLLMLPELMDNWFGKLLEVKYRMAKAGRFFRRLFPSGAPLEAEQLDKDIQGGRKRMASLRNLLMDPNRAQIILVTIPEAMSVMETNRTLEMLRKNNLPVATVVINQLQPASDDCLHCLRRREIHLRELEKMKHLANGIPIKVIESLPREICGLGALAELGHDLWV